MDNSRPESEIRGVSRNSSIFGSAHTINRRLLESPGAGLRASRGMELENDLEVEDYGSVGSDLEMSDSSEFDYYDEDEDEVYAENQERSVVVKADITPRSLDVQSRDDEVEVDSDEERAIVAQIKEEIKNQVKTEMKDELQLYRPAAEGDKKTEPEDDPTLADLEPKLKEAILKMRKLDRILKRKIKREMEVKRDRIRLQKRLRQELEDLKNGSDGGKQPRKEELVNTERFLALAPPPKHNEGVEDESPPVTPVFRTQLPDSEFAEQQRRSEAGGGASGEGVATERGSKTRRTNRSNSTGGATSSMSGTSIGGKSNDCPSRSTKPTKYRSKKKKDFIKRNIELASDAANTIAMTDDEKCRLDQLLTDINNMPDIPEDSDQFLTQAFEVAVVDGEGYRADQDQRDQLSRIESRLSMLAPDVEVRAISSTRELDALKHCQYLSSAMRVSMDLDELGEPSLKETKEEREMKHRLDLVEKQLERMSVHADLEVPTPTFNEDQLNILLGEYARSLSRTTRSESTYRDDDADDGSETPGVASIYENVPKLADDTLQQLLREAKSGLSFHALENECDDTKALKMGNETDLRVSSRSSMDSTQNSARQSSMDSTQNSARQSSRLSRHSDTTRTPRTGNATDRLPERPENEPRVLLPDISQNQCVVPQIPNNQKDRPVSRDRRTDNFIHNSFDLTPSSVSPPLSVHNNTRRTSRPRNLAPISTHLDLNNLSEDEPEQ